MPRTVWIRGNEFYRKSGPRALGDVWGPAALDAPVIRPGLGLGQADSDALRPGAEAVRRDVASLRSMFMIDLSDVLVVIFRVDLTHQIARPV